MSTFGHRGEDSDDPPGTSGPRNPLRSGGTAADAGGTGDVAVDHEHDGDPEEHPEVVRRVNGPLEQIFDMSQEEISRTVLEIAYRVSANNQEAMDLAQDVILGLIRASLKGRLTIPGNPKAFLWTTTRNRWIDSIRKQRGGGEVLHIEDFVDVRDRGEEVADMATTRVLISKCWRASESLTNEQHKKALHLAMSGYSAAEAARVLNIPVTTYRSRLVAAHAELRSIIIRRVGGETK